MMERICLPDDHYFVWVRRWTLQCSICKIECELEDGYPNIAESWHPDLTDEELKMLLTEADAAQRQKEEDERKRAKVETLIDNAIM